MRRNPGPSLSLARREPAVDRERGGAQQPAGVQRHGEVGTRWQLDRHAVARADAARGELCRGAGGAGVQLRPAEPPVGGHEGVPAGVAPRVGGEEGLVRHGLEASTD
jgi:hypothetical protein